MNKNSFLSFIKAPFVNFFNIFNKDFIKERRDLHFAISLLIIYSFLLIGDAIPALQIDQLPFWFIMILGWFGAYFANFIREHYYATKGAKWDWFDVYAGCYGGLVGAIVYIILSY